MFFEYLQNRILIFFIHFMKRNSINELHQTFLTTIAGLETGEYEKTLTDEEWKVSNSIFLFFIQTI